jgi:SAM-dependent methyltransferase
MGWELGHPGPPFVHALDRGLVAPPGRAFVPGCGSGHDALLLAQRGFEVAAVDISPTAVVRARELFAATDRTADVREADLLALPDDLREFDLVLEHTCFCAVPPERRDDYVDAVARSLRPGGRLLGLFFMIEPEEGPPFGATEEEVRHRFGPQFTVDHVEAPPEPHRCPHGREWLFLMTRRG